MNAYIYPEAGGGWWFWLESEDRAALLRDCELVEELKKPRKLVVYHDNRMGDFQALVPSLFQHEGGFDLRLLGDKILRVEVGETKVHMVEHLGLPYPDSIQELQEKHGRFIDAFGTRAHTASGVSFQKLMEIEKIKAPVGGERYDERFRPFYFAGRCEAKFVGDIQERLTLLDLNSAYPAAMVNKHAFGYQFEGLDEMPASRKEWGPCLVWFECTRAGGAFPRRVVNPETGEEQVTFPQEGGEFRATGWEVLAAHDLKLVEGFRVKVCYRPLNVRGYPKFVKRFFEAKMKCKESGDEERGLWNKLVLNSAYGAFGQNPRKFKEALVLPAGELPSTTDWKIAADDQLHGVTYWVRPAPLAGGFRDVWTAASITGFVRARLLRTMASVGGEFFYCDTDSILIRTYDLTKVKLGTKLGDWRIDCEVKRAHIACKKVYAFERPDGSFKTACKGADLSPDLIKKVVEGEAVRWEKEGGCVSWTGQVSEVWRTIKTPLDKYNEKARKRKENTK